MAAGAGVQAVGVQAASEIERAAAMLLMGAQRLLLVAVERVVISLVMTRDTVLEALELVVSAAVVAGLTARTAATEELRITGRVVHSWGWSKVGVEALEPTVWLVAMEESAEVDVDVEACVATMAGMVANREMAVGRGMAASGACQEREVLVASGNLEERVFWVAVGAWVESAALVAA